jgi:predicted nucleic acid-binding Zn finger protein
MPDLHDRKLNNWNFNDPEINDKLPQINRQKSALNLKIIHLNKNQKSAFFADDINTTIDECSCRDFNYIGNSPRKKYAPCMHIYRLAIELGIMESHHIDSKTQLAMMTPEERRWISSERLRAYGEDQSQWGLWPLNIHKAPSQKERIERGFEIDMKRRFINKESNSGLINDYTVTLSSCTCPDFQERKLPCKHIYCLALELKIIT